MNTSRPLEGSNSRGPPPVSNRGFDRISSRYDQGRDVLPAAPPAPNPPANLAPPPVEIAPAVTDRRDGRRARPVSLYQDPEPRSSHMDDYYHSRDDERNMRDLRDRERERDRDRPRDDDAVYDASRFQDDSVVTRGFGIRTDTAVDAYPSERRDTRHDHRRQAEDENGRASDVEREDRRRRRTESKDDRDRRDNRDNRDNRDVRNGKR